MLQEFYTAVSFILIVGFLLVFDRLFVFVGLRLPEFYTTASVVLSIVDRISFQALAEKDLVIFSEWLWSNHRPPPTSTLGSTANLQ